jgi:hypothetical protein
MGTHKMFVRTNRPCGRRSHGLNFEVLESRHLLSGWGTAEPATGTVSDEPSAAVQVRLQLTDLCGQPIDRIPVGGEFRLDVYVDDLRANPRGVFAAYVDVEYDASLVSTTVEDRRGMTFGLDYPNGWSGTIQDGRIDEVGAFAGFTPLLGGESLLFSVPFFARESGVIDFAVRPADTVGREVLIYDSNDPLPWHEIRLVGASLTIDGGAASTAMPTEAGCSGPVVSGSGADLASPEPVAQPRYSFDWQDYADNKTVGPAGMVYGLKDPGVSPDWASADLFYDGAKQMQSVLPSMTLDSPIKFDGGSDNQDWSGGWRFTVNDAWTAPVRMVFSNTSWYGVSGIDVALGRSVPVLHISASSDVASPLAAARFAFTVTRAEHASEFDSTSASGFRFDYPVSAGWELNADNFSPRVAKGWMCGLEMVC